MRGFFVGGGIGFATIAAIEHWHKNPFFAAWAVIVIIGNLVTVKP